MESLGELERLVATVVRVVKTVRTGKGVGTSCSRIDTDNLDVFHSRFAGLANAPERRGIPRCARNDGGFVNDGGFYPGKASLNVIRFLSKSRVK